MHFLKKKFKGGLSSLTLIIMNTFKNKKRTKEYTAVALVSFSIVLVPFSPKES